MKFRHVAEDELQGAISVPVPKDEAGPSHINIIGLAPNDKPRWRLFHKRTYKSGAYSAVWRENTNNDDERLSNDNIEYQINNQTLEM